MYTKDIAGCGIETVDTPLRVGQGVAGSAAAVRDVPRLANAHAHLGIPLPPELARAVEKRRADYTAGRYCATRALAALGLPGGTRVGRGADGAPLWPEGIVGSITHTAGFAWAAAARATDVTAVGIDSEQVMSPELRCEVEGEILGPAESALRAGSAAARQALNHEEYVTLVFSAKESLLKCLYPTCGVLFAPKDIVITRIDPTAGTLDATVTADTLPGAIPREHTVRFVVQPPFVHTGVCLGRGMPQSSTAATKLEFGQDQQDRQDSPSHPMDPVDRVKKPETRPCGVQS